MPSWLATGIQTDPLAGIPFAARLQAHNNVIAGNRTTLLVSGAGTAAVNGAYALSSLGVWNKGDASTILWWYNANQNWYISRIDFGVNYYTCPTVTLETDSPAGLTFTPIDGVNPPPTVTAVSSPFARPLGLYTDAGMTTPAVNWGDEDYNWVDKLSASGAVVSQSIGTQRPVTQYAPLPSGVWVPCPVFDGVDDSVATSGNIGITGSQPFTLFFSSKLNTTYNQTIVTLGADNPTEYCGALCINGFWYFNGYTNDQESTTPADTLWHVHCISYDGANLNWQIDGLTPIGNFPVTKTLNTASGPLVIGVSNGLYYLNGMVGSCLVVESLLSDANKTKCFNYLAALLPA